MSCLRMWPQLGQKNYWKSSSSRNLTSSGERDGLTGLDTWNSGAFSQHVIYTLMEETGHGGDKMTWKQRTDWLP